MFQRRRTEFGNAHPIGNDIDRTAGETVVAHNFVAHHRRVSDDASRPALGEQGFFQPQNDVVFFIKPASDSLQRILKPGSAIDPRPMDTVAGAEKIAAPDTFQAYHEITMSWWVAALQFVGKCDRVFGGNANNAA